MSDHTSRIHRMLAATAGCYIPKSALENAPQRRLHPLGQKPTVTAPQQLHVHITKEQLDQLHN